MRNHIEDEALRSKGVLINMGVNFGLVSHQAENRPIKITIGVNIF